MTAESTSNSKQSAAKIFLICVFAAGFWVSSFIFAFSIAKTNYTILASPQELANILEQQTARMVVIDLRETTDYEAGHIPGAINIPYINGIEVLTYLESHGQKNRTIYLMCYSGYRAAQVFNTLKAENVKNITYINFGYAEYEASMGADFIAETGPCFCLD